MSGANGLLIQDRELEIPRFDALEGEEFESAVRELKENRSYQGAELTDRLPIFGFAHAILRNPDGEIKFEALLENLITLVGNQYYGERAAAIGTPPNQVTGLRLGTGTTAPAATGAGAFIVTYTTGSNVAVTGGYPQSSNPSGGIRRVTWAGSWAAGVATNSALAEAVLTNETPLTNVQGSAANTIARILLSPTVNKGASDTFDLFWQHDIGS
jgi:hypothetical protein